MTSNKTVSKGVEKLFAVGAHLGFSKSRRNASMKPYVLSTKNGSDIINLEMTEAGMTEALAFATELGKGKKTLLFVGTKPEARTIVETGAQSIAMPYVVNRWVGGMLTNWGQIKKRLEKRDDLMTKKASGELEKYTKKERLLIDDEMEGLSTLFGGLHGVTKLPDALFIIDPRHESIAVKEAVMLGIPTIALLNTDCSTKGITYPMVGNDGARESITFFTNAIVSAYEEGAKL